MNVKRTIMVIVAVLLIAVGVITPAVAQEATYPLPAGGYTCFPTCDETDGRFISMPGDDMNSFGGAKTVLWISVPADYETFELGIFDGDSGRGPDGNVGSWRNGNWDDTTTQSTYILYTDPLKDGPTDGEIQIGSWTGNDPNPTSGTYCTTSADIMPNNDWYTITCQNVDEARASSGHYFYRVEMTRSPAGTGINALKVRSNAYLSTGQADLVDASFAIVSMAVNIQDLRIIHPEFTTMRNPGPSNYDGTWDFYFHVASEKGTVEFWDGDFDHSFDTDDPNTQGTPSWTDGYVVLEGEGGQGSPPDDYWWNLFRREPAVWYEVIHPDGFTIYVNDNPSGSEEWEWFSVSTDPNADADVLTDHLGPGYYTWHIEGLDIHNTVWIRINYELMVQPTPPVWPESAPPAPRTIGYWKNNVNKVLIQGKTKDVQETQESLEQALLDIASASVLFRSGIDVEDPGTISTITPLTAEEANAILQKTNGNSMLDRALQQNLAAWLNLGSGKVNPITEMTLEVHGGTFEGTFIQALYEAQFIILNGGDLERAKDIADQINNGAW